MEGRVKAVHPAPRAAVGRALAIGLGLWLGAGSALADPMRPLDGTATASLEPAAEPGSPAADAQAAARLSATRSDGAGRWEALIGTQWLRPGDRLDGARVQEVGANHVLLLRDGQRQTVYLLAPLQPSKAAALPRAWPAPASHH
jgi:hypothetical protein